jgi:hypothetical protein
MVSILQLTNQIGGDLSKMVSILQLTSQIGGDLSKMVINLLLFDWSVVGYLPF